MCSSDLWIGEPVTARILEPIFSLFGLTNPQTIHTLSVTFGFVFLTARGAFLFACMWVSMFFANSTYVFTARCVGSKVFC